MHLHEFTTCRGKAVHQISPPDAKDLEIMNIHEPGFIEYQAREYGNHALPDMSSSLTKEINKLDHWGRSRFKLQPQEYQA